MGESLLKTGSLEARVNVQSNVPICSRRYINEEWFDVAIEITNKKEKGKV